MTDKKNMRYTYQIYKISSDYCDKFYIGSTRDFTSRKSKHKTRCNNPTDKAHNTKVYRTIRENGGWENFRMTCIEIMENTTKLEAEIREEQLRMELKALLNSKKATCGGITRQEYKKQHCAENRDHIKEYSKQYREENREQINAHKREKFDCICGGKYSNAHKIRHSKSIKHQKYLDTLGKSI